MITQKKYVFLEVLFYLSVRTKTLMTQKQKHFLLKQIILYVGSNSKKINIISSMASNLSNIR